MSHATSPSFAPGLLGRSARMLARGICRFPGRVLLALGTLAVVAGFAASHLTINSNQLDLIRQDLRQVQDVKRIIDMVGGNGFLVLALRGDNAPNNTLKRVADDLNTLLAADTEHVRAVTYRMPVAFIQQNIGLFVQTEDLITFKGRVAQYLKKLVRAQNPFFLNLRDQAPPKLDVDDLRDKYGHVGQKSLLDDYYISPDQQMLLLLIKPRWDNNSLDKTHDYLDKLRADLANYGAHNERGVALAEDYTGTPVQGIIGYGFTGSYKTSLDDSFAIKESLEPVSLWAIGSIALITLLFFRKLVPSLIVMSGMVVGTVLTMGFCKISVGQLNMITSILGGILMGFGVDYGIHFIFRTRIELGEGKDYETACIDALLNAGRPASVAAIVTGGSFLTLCASNFKGFSQFGFLAGFGTLIIGATMFSWCAAWVCLLGRVKPAWVPRLIGTMSLQAKTGGHGRLPRPWLWLGASAVAVALVSAAALPWPATGPLSHFGSGVHFNYNSRALMAENQPSIRLQDEINRRYHISSDPVAVYTPDLAATRRLYDELTDHKDRYPSIAQVMSIFTFVPPQPRAARNAEIMHAWRQELEAQDLTAMAEGIGGDVKPFLQALSAEPFDVAHVPEMYASQFRHLPSARPENHGYLTFLYPAVDLWDGVQMLQFADEVDTIVTGPNEAFHAAGSPMLFAQLARTVLFDGKLTLILAALWIFTMHYIDFRRAGLAVASVLPLGLGLSTMLGVMAMTHHPLNFMNIIMLPILLGFGVSHGLYLLHRFLEGTPTVVALRSVGAAVLSSTATAIAGFASLFAASHQGLQSMGYVAVLGLATTLVISFTVLAAVLQLMEDHNKAP